MSDLDKLKTRFTRITVQIEQLEKEKAEVEDKFLAMGIESIEDAENSLSQIRDKLKDSEEKYEKLFQETESAISEIEEKLK
ncbi:MAG TPA: hypothetical protein VKR58_06205 [Aquella sp.]|nr:hypothetical protein [Aquella sp.]